MNPETLSQFETEILDDETFLHEIVSGRHEPTGSREQSAPKMQESKKGLKAETGIDQISPRPCEDAALISNTLLQQGSLAPKETQETNPIKHWLVTTTKQESGISESQRTLISRIAKIAKISQKKDGRKKTGNNLAQECLAWLEHHTLNPEDVQQLQEQISGVANVVPTMQQPPDDNAQETNIGKKKSTKDSHSFEENMPEPCGDFDSSDALVQWLLSVTQKGALVEENRRTIAVIAKFLQIPQKEQKRKKNSHTLAQECLTRLRTQSISSDSLQNLNAEFRNFTRTGSKIHKPSEDLNKLAATHADNMASLQSNVPSETATSLSPNPMGETTGARALESEGGDVSNVPDKAFLRRIANGQSLPETDRVRLQEISKQLKVPQKQQRRKKTQQQLAKDCLQSMQQKHMKNWFTQKKHSKDIEAQTQAPELSKEEEMARKKRRVKQFVETEISGAKAQTLKQWACKCGYYVVSTTVDATDMMQKEFLNKRLQEILNDDAFMTETLQDSTEDTASKAKVMMETFETKTAIKLQLGAQIATGNYRTLRKWARQCGFRNQQDFEDDLQGYKHFLHACMLKSLHEYTAEELDLMGQVETMVENIRIHMMTEEKMDAKSLLLQHPRRKEMHNDAESRLHQIVLQIQDFAQQNNRLPCVHVKEKEAEHNKEKISEKTLAKHIVYARNVLQYDQSSHGSQSRKLFESIYLWSWLPQPESQYQANLPECELHQWSDDAIATAPLVCQLCGQGAANQSAFMKHIGEVHVSYVEYRKRVLFLRRKEGPKALKASEKRNIVQAFCHHESTSTIASQSNCWPQASAESTVPRQEAACVICARLDWIEHRIPIHLFKNDSGPDNDPEASDNSASEDEDDRTHESTKTCAPIAKSHLLHKLFDVERYAERWPLIPKSELVHASVKHPFFDMRWLLHTRRIQMTDGVADATATCLVCPDCLKSISKRKPTMPKFALCNDLWIGRHHPDFRHLSDAMRWLLSLARPVWKTIYLGPQYSTGEAKQVGSTNNCLFVAQPTAEITAKILPPRTTDVQNSLVIAFTGKSCSLKNAKWAEVNRNLYLKCALLRKKICASFQEITVDECRIATEFPEQGSPALLESCMCNLKDCETLSPQTDGPATIPNLQADCKDETQPESGSSSEEIEPEAQHLAPEQMIATDAGSDADPISAFTLFQKNSTCFKNKHAMSSKMKRKFVCSATMGLLSADPCLQGGARPEKDQYGKTFSQRLTLKILQHRSENGLLGSPGHRFRPQCVTLKITPAQVKKWAPSARQAMLFRCFGGCVLGSLDGQKSRCVSKPSPGAK